MYDVAMKKNANVEQTAIVYTYSETSLNPTLRKLALPEYLPIF
jgi:hypothetical protein